MTFKTHKLARRGGAVYLRALLGTALVPLAACNADKLLNVVDPANATPNSLQNAASVPAVVSGAIGDFQAAYSGNQLNDAYLPTTGLFTDEFRSSDTFTTRNDLDRRTQTSPANGNLGDIAYVELHQARRSAELAYLNVLKFFPATDPRAAELLSLAAYTYVSFGEGYCSGVPFAVPVASADVAVQGPALTTSQMFDSAAARFSKALTGLGSGTDAVTVSRRNLASVGLGRALLNNGNYAAAATAVANVPTSFVYFDEHSSNTNREQNSLWNLNGSNRRYTVSDVEGINGLPYRTSNDPRIPWLDQKRNGFDNATRLYEQLRYNDPSSNVPLSDGIEARLIGAEAALKAGNTTTWLATLNALRADVRNLMTVRYKGYATSNPNAFVTNSTLAPLTDPGTDAARVNLMFAERGYWLYATGHRLGDYRRLIRQYGRGAETVFPTGAW
ncbi:MAG: hypothetical protein ACR2M1_02905, partial [Gemmatimonadaceae bacterium]